MLLITQLKSNEFEIQDEFTVITRERDVLLTKIFKSLIGLFSFSFIFLLYYIFVNFKLGNLFFMIINLILIQYLIKIHNRVKNSLSNDIGSIIILFDKKKNLINFKIRKWIQGNSNLYTEEDIRFNQSVGFRVEINRDEYFDIKIIVDASHQGVNVISVQDLYTVAEFKLLFEKISTQFREWILVDENSTVWDEEYLSYYEECLEIAELPTEIIEFLEVN
ncbi:MAG: hypothetical protein OEZ01_02045 [Candidatus Heimdallarchaeota archaeon]|nr:hypothetical protein [Candidatus Heimdallarchaeota archaeon]MDH5644756.1 hypothetical protein [Candidatus Heimdallarchaeota archaeon]